MLWVCKDHGHELWEKEKNGLQLVESCFGEGFEEVFHNTWYVQKRRRDTCERVKRYHEHLKISRSQQIVQDEFPPKFLPVLDDIGNVVQLSRESNKLV
jgi:hypothetical protein